mmetsp:Transcript_48854/g.118254  ORF Transcript_48854/g.118254 Transcript_48854/m.118254 type:complete len:118 (+) Transcript_48854:1390-1743(+)
MVRLILEHECKFDVSGGGRLFFKDPHTEPVPIDDTWLLVRLKQHGQRTAKKIIKEEPPDEDLQHSVSNLARDDDDSRHSGSSMDDEDDCHGGSRYSGSSMPRGNEKYDDSQHFGTEI